jgi:hypothetical protein
MRPCTLHYVITAENAVVLGRHFYSSSAIQRTVLGVVHTFMLRHAVTNDSHDETRTMLRRMFYMWSNSMFAAEASGGWASYVCFGGQSLI